MMNFSFDNLFARIVTEERCLERGELLFKQGDIANHIYTIQTGAIKLLRYTETGTAVCIHTAWAGESFAEAALFSDIYHCDAEATEPSSVYCYPKDEIFSILHEHTDKSDQFIALLARQVRSLRALLEVRAIRDARERIMRFLLLRVNPKSHEIHLKGTYKEMASELGLAHETFYRVLATLEKEKMISRTPTSIKIIQFPTV